MASTNSSSNGLGLSGTVAVVFIVLKLVHVIDWSWWWVLSPLWIGLGLALVVFGVIFLVVWIKENK